MLTNFAIAMACGNAALQLGGKANPLEIQTAFALVGMTSYAGVLFATVSFLCLLGWIYRAHGNLPALRATELRFDASVAALLCFIPVVNLVTLWIVLNEIWYDSDPALLIGSPARRRRASSAVLSLWMILAWLNVLASLLVVVGFLGVTEKPELELKCYLLAGCALLGVAQCVAALVSVYTMTQNQKLRYHDTAGLNKGRTSSVVIPVFPDDQP